MPQIVKVSGGRSSGMMLLRLLETGTLDPSRGDVAIFTNTSAEHSATYTFLSRLKTVAEERGLPFFWLEFCTYEDAVRGEWTRRNAYRLVNDRPAGPDNPDGYHHHGEVFEEMLSSECATPSMQKRFCTRTLKVAPSNAFLVDWFGVKDGPKRLGHFGSESRLTDDAILDRHEKNRGRTPRDIFLAKKRYVRERSLVRPAQRFADFSAVPRLWRPPVPKKLFGPRAVPFISNLGLRADEAHRVEKTEHRISRKRGSRSQAWGDQPPGEAICAPLVEARVNRDAVSAFWKMQPFDLELPADGRYGNCVFCMMKGRIQLTELARECPAGTVGPESIDWWIEMEAKYGRDLIAEQRKIEQENVTHFGFFGPATGPVYADIRSSIIACKTNKNGYKTDADADFLVDESYEICECTD